MNRARAQVHTYREQELAGKSPEELLLFLLDTGAGAARRRDRKLLTGVLTELIGGLDFEHKEIASRLITLYDFAVREARENRFEFPERLLSELAQTFRRAMASRVSPTT